ncbi:MAG TPA: ArsA-related P-loop ATPase [Solirubrobacteraceae bacterium]|nr:ArsA-related P-loop ATPase [Solirubrobacteraceae bacterium]
MRSLLDRRLLVITGKGGVGKSTVAAALGLLASQSGRSTLVVELGQEQRLPAIFGREAAAPGSPCPLGDGLASLTLDPDRALLEWLQALGGRVSGRLLASSGTFQYFAAAAPGAKELVTMVQLWRLAGGGARRRGSERRYDLVVLDAPATGHALGLLGSPRTFGSIAGVGPIAAHARRVLELLQSPERSGYLAVALATEMAVTEALKLDEGLRRALDRPLDAVVVNGLMPRRFSASELRAVSALEGVGASDAERAAVCSAIRAAAAAHARARFQHAQLARLRRRSFAVAALPFVWQPALGRATLEALAARLGRGLRALR